MVIETLTEYLILISLATTGMTGIMIYSDVFQPFRETWCSLVDYKYTRFLQTLSFCCLCLGFWVSLFIQNFFFEPLAWREQIFFAMISAFVCWLLNAICQYYLYEAARSKNLFSKEYVEVFEEDL